MTHSPLHPVVAEVSTRIEQRSQNLRQRYLAGLKPKPKRARSSLGCSNQAHAYAAMASEDRLRLVAESPLNLGLVSSYNDMLSAHQPYEHYPEQLRGFARAAGASLQVAGGVPAMCDGITQGEADVNHFDQAGGTAFLFAQLLRAGLLHRTVNTVMARICRLTPAAQC